MSRKEKDPAITLRGIPKIDALLGLPEVEGLARTYSRPFVADLVREAVAALRASVTAGEASREQVSGFPGRLPQWLRETIAARLAGRITGVINATGVIVHTNLGRSPLAGAAAERAREVSAGYSDLEYDLAEGRRGSRLAHVESLLGRLFPGRAGLMVNNNAAAVLLALNALAEGREVLLSRGELVEIGGSFRIPEIMAKSGARLHEVGTTNRTRLADFEKGLSEKTGLLMKVHSSNYRIVGFVEEASLEDLAALARARALPLLVDQGSGNLLDLTPFGLRDEAPVAAILARGADVITFSGDKLLGGPQAGILVGRPDLIGRMKQNPLYRAMRPGKGSIAAMEATLEIFVSGDPFAEIPTLRMLSTPLAELHARAGALAARLRDEAGGALEAHLVEGFSRVGGGSAPGEDLPTWLVALVPARGRVEAYEAALRCGTPPVVGRVREGRYLVDLRTVPAGREDELAGALKAALPGE